MDGRPIRLEPGVAHDGTAIRQCSTHNCNGFVTGARHKVRCNDCQTRWVQELREARQYGDYEGYGGHGEGEQRWRAWGEDLRRENRARDERERERERELQDREEERQNRGRERRGRYRGPVGQDEQQYGPAPQQQPDRWVPPPPPHPADFLRNLAAVMPWPPGYDPAVAARARFDQDEAAHRREMERRQLDFELRRLEMDHEMELARVNLERAKYLYGSKGAEKEVGGEREN